MKGRWSTVRVKLMRVPSRLMFLVPIIIAALLNRRQPKTLELKARLPVALGPSTKALRRFRDAGRPGATDREDFVGKTRCQSVRESDGTIEVDRGGLPMLRP